MESWQAAGQRQRLVPGRDAGEITVTVSTDENRHASERGTDGWRRACGLTSMAAMPGSALSRPPHLLECTAEWMRKWASRTSIAPAANAAARAPHRARRLHCAAKVGMPPLAASRACSR